MKNRSEIAPEFTWDLSHIFATQEAWEAAYADCEAGMAKIPGLRGRIGKSPEELKAVYDEMYAYEQKLMRVGEYAFLSKALDGGDVNAQKMCDRVITLETRVMAGMAFLEPELMAIPEETLSAWLKLPELAGYRHILEDATRLRAHVLDEKSEAMMARFGRITGTASDVYDMLTNVEMQWPVIKGEDGADVTVTPGMFHPLRESKDKRVRDDAFKAMFGEYGKFNNTLATIYGGSVKKDNLLADLRGYSSARAASLSSNNVPESVYDALITAVRGAVPSMEKYLALRAKALKTENLDVYDLYVPIVEGVDWPMSYEEAKDLVIKAVAPLGEEYQNVLREAYANRWIDVYETPGKESGAFSAGIYGVHPYVKLNFAGTLDDAFTLAHELGHSMHSYRSSAAQDFANHDYSLLVAEVASTVNEVLLTKYLLSVETDPKRRAYVLNHFLEGFRTTVFRQTLFAEFEYKAHQAEQAGTPLTAAFLNDLYAGLVKDYYPTAAMREELKYEWSFIPHFYNNFYVYVYATGFCSAVAIASGIVESGDASAYLKFLSTGGSDYPINELKIAGIDLTSPAVVANAMKVFDESIDELAELIG